MRCSILAWQRGEHDQDDPSFVGDARQNPWKEDAARVLHYTGGTLVPDPGDRGKAMLWAIAMILFLLWAVGFFGAHAFGGFIHLLLVAAVVVMMLNVLQGRRWPA
jgi:hypothetical protein